LVDEGDGGPARHRRDGNTLWPTEAPSRRRTSHPSPLFEIIPRMRDTRPITH
jgi:hypothetical protein